MAIAHLLLILLPFLSSLIDEPQRYRYDLTVKEGSDIIIHGSTNVNNFDCGYTGHIATPGKEVTSNRDGLTLFVKNADFSLKVMDFDCDNSLMSKEFHETLKGEDFPIIQMSLLQLIFKSEDDIMGGRNVDLKTHMKVVAAGVPKEYLVRTKRSFDADLNTVIFKGTFKVMIEDFHITPPVKAFGLVKVNSELIISYDLRFSTERTLIN